MLNETVDQETTIGADASALCFQSPLGIILIIYGGFPDTHEASAPHGSTKL